MDCSTPGLPVHHQLPESTQTHVHWVGDAIQPSHPLSSPSPPAFNLSRHHGLFQWVSSLHGLGQTCNHYSIIHNTCSHEIKRCLLLGRRVMTNLNSILKGRSNSIRNSIRTLEMVHIKKKKRERIQQIVCRRNDYRKILCTFCSVFL